MSFQVIYFSRKGSTKKIADAIASELNIKAEDVRSAKITEDFIFLGSGCYGGKPSESMEKFIQDNDFENKKIALFGTSGGGVGAEVNVMEALLKKKNANILGKYFCKGKFMFANRKKPNEEDIENAKQFARKIIN